MFPGAPTKRVSVGIVGFGRQGEWHFQNLWNALPFKVAWVFDANPMRTEHLPKLLRVNSLSDALQRDARIVVVVTPPSSHFRIARSFLLAGRNIVLEKPTTTSSRETGSLLDLARRRHLFLLTRFNRRWDRDFLTVAHALQSYDFGRLHEIESRVTDQYGLNESYPHRARWKLRQPDGGILLDWAPHLLDQLFELMGRRRPMTIYCRKYRPNRIVAAELEEQFTIQIEYPGCLATLGASWNAGLPRARWILSGTRAALSLSEEEKPQGAIRWSRDGKIFSRTLVLRPPVSEADALRGTVIKSLRTLRTPAKEADRMRMVSYGIDQARSSCLKGKPVPWKLAL